MSDEDRALMQQWATTRAEGDFGKGEWKQCAIGSTSPVPGVCPDGAWTYPGTHNPEVHDHWVPEQSREPEVYWWMECLLVVVRHNADGQTVRAFVYQPSTRKYWWKTQPWPLPARNEAVRIPLPPEVP